ncbi:CLUMA_CG015524, isoform A [Clunio marinus]|uniref:CLUMA_CG015524, isoform A n=1 Tax=Clunio marinus TaxID=568069 RepID=A0A1J1IP19_9DIPT|nr:CLUMA_CG015524, isoform A [Clunio marinus]
MNVVTCYEKLTSWIFLRFPSRIQKELCLQNELCEFPMPLIMNSIFKVLNSFAIWRIKLFQEKRMKSSTVRDNENA